MVQAERSLMRRGTRTQDRPGSEGHTRKTIESAATHASVLMRMGARNSEPGTRAREDLGVLADGAVVADGDRLIAVDECVIADGTLHPIVRFQGR